MSNKNQAEKIKEIEGLLRKCNDFINNAKTEWEEDLKEAEKDYQDSCQDLYEAEKECEKMLSQAVRENYDENRMAATKKLCAEIISSAEKQKATMFEYLQKAREDQKRFSELLEAAKKDREKFEIQLDLLKQQTSSPLKWIVNIGFWVIVIIFVLKACS